MTTTRALAQVYAEFNALHSKALAESPSSRQYAELLEQMELIVVDVRRAFGGKPGGRG